MLNGIWNGARGSVRIRIDNQHPEKILNLCAEENIYFWDARWTDNGAFTCRISRRDWKKLNLILEREKIEKNNINNKNYKNNNFNMDLENFDLRDLNMENPEGAPYFLARIHRRHALFISLVIAITALFLGSFFIWDFQIIGNKTVAAEKILRALEKQNIKIGTFGLALDSEDIRNHVLLDVPELEWIAVNVSGCRANVRVVERVKPPEIWDRETPSDMRARRDGLILEIHALDGVPEVRPGMSVTAGEILISGAEDLETTGATRIMAGDGSILARTWYKLQTKMDLNILKKQATGRRENLYSLIIGKHRIKIPGFYNLNNLNNNNLNNLENLYCDKNIKYTRWTPFEIALPVILVQERREYYDFIPDVLSVAEAQNRGEKVLREYLESQVAPYGEIRSALCTSQRRGDFLEITLSAECIEEIGVRVPAGDYF